MFSSCATSRFLDDSDSSIVKPWNFFTWPSISKTFLLGPSLAREPKKLTRKRRPLSSALVVGDVDNITGAANANGVRAARRAGFRHVTGDAGGGGEGKLVDAAVVPSTTDAELGEFALAKRNRGEEAVGCGGSGAEVTSAADTSAPVATGLRHCDRRCFEKRFWLKGGRISKVSRVLLKEFGRRGVRVK